MRGKDKNCLFRRISLFSTLLKVNNAIHPWAGDNKHFSLKKEKNHWLTC